MTTILEEVSPAGMTSIEYLYKAFMTVGNSITQGSMASVSTMANCAEMGKDITTLTREDTEDMMLEMDPKSDKYPQQTASYNEALSKWGTYSQISETNIQKASDMYKAELEGAQQNYSLCKITCVGVWKDLAQRLKSF